MKKIIALAIGPSIDVTEQSERQTLSKITLSLSSWYEKFGAIFKINDKDKKPLLCFISKENLVDMDPKYDALRVFFQNWTNCKTLEHYLATSAQFMIEAQVVETDEHYDYKLSMITPTDVTETVEDPSDYPIAALNRAIEEHRITSLDEAIQRIDCKLQTRLEELTTQLETIQTFITYTSLHLSFARYKDDDSAPPIRPEFPMHRIKELLNTLNSTIDPETNQEAKPPIELIYNYLDYVITDLDDIRHFRGMPSITPERWPLDLDKKYANDAFQKSLTIAYIGIYKFLRTAHTSMPRFARVIKAFKRDPSGTTLKNALTASTQDRLWQALLKGLKT